MKTMSSEFAKDQTEILGMLKVIESSLYDCTDSSLNWGHVGNIKHVKELLSEICDFMNNGSEK